MTITEQIDGLRALAIEPIRYLIVPRVAAINALAHHGAAEHADRIIVLKNGTVAEDCRVADPRDAEQEKNLAAGEETTA